MYEIITYIRGHCVKLQVRYRYLLILTLWYLSNLSRFILIVSSNLSRGHSIKDGARLSLRLSIRIRKCGLSFMRGRFRLVVNVVNGTEVA